MEENCESMIYFYVKFLKKNSDNDFSSNKEYLYKTEDTVLVNEVLDSFRRVDNFSPYSSKARVTRIVSCNEALNTNIDIKEVVITAKHIAKDVINNWNTINERLDFTNFDPFDTDFNLFNTITGPTNTFNSYFAKFEPNPEIEVNTKDKKEKTMNMNSIFKNMNLDFGKVIDNQIAYSIKGMAVGSNIGTAQESYKTYDGEITDVTGLVIKDMPLYKMPVAIKDIAEGDMVIHQGRAVIVEVINDDGTLVVVDVANATEITIYPVKNIFGFNFYTKIVNPFNGMLNEVNDDNPFGNMLPYMMLMNSSSMDKNDILIMCLMSGNTMMGDNMNMLMPFMLFNRNDEETKGDNDFITAMLMMNMMNANQAKTKNVEED